MKKNFLNHLMICSLVLTFKLILGTDNLEASVEKKTIPANQYLLPENHKLKPILDSIFTSCSVIKNPSNFKAAGFKTISLRRRGFLRIANHPLVKGYVFKVYLTHETNYSLDSCNARFTQRCKSARAVRQIIKQYNLNRFSVPTKWLYNIQLPDSRTAYVLIARDMHLLSRAQCRRAWRKKMNRIGLKQLYTVFHAGYSSTKLASNIPYTRNKKFSFIDVETYQKKIDLTKVDNYLSPKLRPVWREIVKKNQTLIQSN